MPGGVLDESEDFYGRDPAAVLEDEQRLVARLVHHMTHADTDALFRIYVTSRRYFGQGGTARIQHTLVPLVFGALRLASRVRAIEMAPPPAAAAAASKPPKPPPAEGEEGGEGAEGGVAEAEAEAEAEEPPPAPAPAVEVQFSCRKIFQFMHEIITAMAPSYPDLSLKVGEGGASVTMAWEPFLSPRARTSRSRSLSLSRPSSSSSAPAPPTAVTSRWGAPVG